MFTSKQRSNLRSMAQTMQPVGQVGKGGIGENLLTSFSDALDARELIKIGVLNNVEDDPGSIAETLAEKLLAEVVEVKGKKIVLYRRSGRKDFKHLEF